MFTYEISSYLKQNSNKDIYFFNCQADKKWLEF